MADPAKFKSVSVSISTYKILKYLEMEKLQTQIKLSVKQ